MVYDTGGKLVAEYGASAPTTTNLQYVTSDYQNSTRVVTNSSGAIANRRDYLPFGEEIGATVGSRTTGQGFGLGDNVRQKHAGMETDDATGMAHTLWRKQDNLSGRWTSPDPYGGSMTIAAPQTFNRYSYCENDPVNLTDPSGLFQMTDASNGWNDVANGFWGWGDLNNRAHSIGREIIDNGANGFPDRPDDDEEEKSDEDEEAQQKENLQGAVEGSPGVEQRFFDVISGGVYDGMAAHDGVHVLSPLTTASAQVTTIPALTGKVIYWNVQEGTMGKPGALYTVRVKPDKGDFVIVYKDLSSVSSQITKGMPAGKVNWNSKVRLDAKSAIGTVNPGITRADPTNKAGRGLHVTFVKSKFYKQFANETKKDNWKTFGSLNPASIFIDPCSAASPVRCR